MGIEAFDKILNLNASFPESGDTKSQGDDHLRGIKSTLQTTFPNADRAFRFPRIRTVNATTAAVTIADDNATIYGFTGNTAPGAGPITINLPTVPATLTWQLQVIKASADPNVIQVSTPSGVFNRLAGVFGLNVSSIYIHTQHDAHTFLWTGTEWLYIYNGVPPGAVCTKGVFAPIGWRDTDGSVLSPASNFPLLNIVLQGTTLPTIANHIIRLC